MTLILIVLLCPRKQDEAAPSLPAVPILLREGGGLLRAPGPPESKAQVTLLLPWREDSTGKGQATDTVRTACIQTPGLSACSWPWDTRAGHSTSLSLTPSSFERE